MKKSKKMLSMMSIAQKAGKVKSGEFAAEKAIKSGAAALCIVAGDASEATKKSYRDMCGFYNTDYLEFADKQTLGHAIGKEFRAAVCICDVNFAEGILKNASGEQNNAMEVDEWQG